VSLRTDQVEINYCENVLAGMRSLWGDPSTYPAGSHRENRWKALSARLRAARGKE
jgi:hypothetical protein